MVLAHEDNDESVYWYARILGVFHVYVLQTGSEPSAGGPQKMEFLWVRWFGADPTHHSGFQHRRLPRVGFVNEEDSGAFGFLAPQDVLRGVHMIPAFAHGATEDLLQGPSIARRSSEDDEDWQFYYVNM